MAENWQRSLANVKASIREVAQVIENASLRAAFIIDDNENFLGVVTDGDIRRALLNDVSFDANVSVIMNRSPVTCPPNQSKQLIKTLLGKNKLLQIPIVDGSKLLDVVTIDDFTPKIRHENPVFVMAGGFGTRLNPLTVECPKPMLKVGGKPMLESMIERFTAQGFSEFYISVHYKAESITSYFGDGSYWGVSINYIHESTPLGTAGALSLMPEDARKLPVIVINGDVLSQINMHALLDYHHSNPAHATMCIRELRYDVPYGVIESSMGRVHSITEKPCYKYHINAGIYVLERCLLDNLVEGEPIDMPELFETQIAAGNVINVYPITEYWLDIGRKQDFDRAQTDYENLFNA